MYMYKKKTVSQLILKIIAGRENSKSEKEMMKLT